MEVGDRGERRLVLTKRMRETGSMYMQERIPSAVGVLTFAVANCPKGASMTKFHHGAPARRRMAARLGRVEPYKLAS